MSQKIIFCRNCKSRKLENLFSLGKLSYTGKFPKNSKPNVKSEKLNLVKCGKCNLVQLDRNFNPKRNYDCWEENCKRHNCRNRRKRSRHVKFHKRS